MNGKRFAAAVALGASMAAGVSSAFAGAVIFEHGPNLVVNGGFEATSSIAAPGSGWTGPGLSFSDVDTIPADARSGNHSFAGGEIGAPGFISQNIATSAGQNYNIHLWLADLSGFADGTAIQVFWGGNLVYSATDILGSGYTEIVVDPMATSAITTLSIGLQDDSFFLNIDDISVRAVPEPASLALLGLGLFGIRFARRKAA